MLQVYMDDSGSHDGAHNCVIGGYWGSVNEWRKFEREWNAILDEYGIEEFKSRTYFRMSNGRRVPPYREWDNKTYAGFLDKLLGTIASRKIYPFATGIIGEQWSSLPANLRIRASGVDAARQKNSLIFLLYKVIYTCVDYCHDGLTMNFTFDDSSDLQLKALMLEAFRDIKEDLAERCDPMAEKLCGLRFEDSKKKAVQLQAADLLAYQAHRYERESQGNKSHPVSLNYARTIINIKSEHDFWLYDAARLEPIKNYFEHLKREEKLRYAAQSI